MNNHTEGKKMSVLALYFSTVQVSLWLSIDLLFFYTLLSQHTMSIPLVANTALFPLKPTAWLFSHTEGGTPQNSP